MNSFFQEMRAYSTDRYKKSDGAFHVQQNPLNQLLDGNKREQRGLNGNGMERRMGSMDRIHYEHVFNKTDLDDTANTSSTSGLGLSVYI